MPGKTKAISLRLPPELHQSARRFAERRGMSLNMLLIDTLSRVMREEEERAFSDSFTLLGQDAEESSSEYAIPAQSEVMLHGDA